MNPTTKTTELAQRRAVCAAGRKATGTDLTSGKHTAPCRLPSLQRARFLKGNIPDFVIADFVSDAMDTSFRKECRRRKLVLPPDLAHLALPDDVSKS